MGAFTSPSVRFRKSIVLLFCTAATNLTVSPKAEAAPTAPTAPVLTACGQPITMGFDKILTSAPYDQYPLAAANPYKYSDTSPVPLPDCPPIRFNAVDANGTIINPIGALNAVGAGVVERGITSVPVDLIFGGSAATVIGTMEADYPFALMSYQGTSFIMSKEQVVVTSLDATGQVLGSSTVYPTITPGLFRTSFVAPRYDLSISVPADAVQVIGSPNPTPNGFYIDDVTVQYVPPATPTNVVGTVMNGAAQVTADTVPYAQSYNVYVNGLLYKSGLTTPNMVVSGRNGVALSVQETAVNFAGESAASGLQWVIPNTIPLTPSITVSPGNGVVNYTITANDPTATSFALLAGGRVAGTTTSLTGTLPGTNGTELCVRSEGINSAGTSNPSAQSCTTPVAGTVAAPVFSLAAGTYVGAQQLTITDLTTGTKLYYTTDGTTPTTSSGVYTGAFAVAQNETVKVLATKSGWASTTASATYIITAPPVTAKPVIGLPSGTYTGPQSVTITDATSGAVIYYTTNGTTPTTASNVYNGPLTVSSSETLEASALAPLNTMSPTAIAAYTINAAPLPTLPQATVTPTPCKGGQIETISVLEATAISYKLNDGAVTAYNSAGVSIPTNGGTLVVTATASGHQASTTSFTCAAAVATDNPPPASPPPATGGGTSGGAVGPVVLGGLVGLAFWRRRITQLARD